MWQEILKLDQQALLALNGSWGHFWDMFFFYFSNIPIWIPMYILVVYFMWKKEGTRGFLWAVLCLVIAVTVADQTCNFFKTHTPKLRPTHIPDIQDMVHYVKGYRGGLYGTVSGHAALSFTFAVFTSKFFKKRWYTIAVFSWAAITAWSRIYLGVHFPLDIIFGTALGLTLGFTSFYIYRRIMKNRLGKA